MELDEPHLLSAAMIGMEMIIAGSATQRSTPQGRWGACAGVTTTRAAKSRMSVRTARIAIMDKVALALEQPVHRIRQVAADLIHPQPTGTRRDPTDLHLPGRQFQEKQDDKPL